MIWKTFHFVLLISLLSSCGSFLDIMGKGEKRECLSFDTRKQLISCNCENKQISSITVYRNRNAKENFGTRTHQFAMKSNSPTFTLPISKDSLDNYFWQIEIHLSDSHWRESYYFKTQPGDFSKSQTIYSRYFSH